MLGAAMFGYVQISSDSLTPEEKARYEAVYCGLCRTLGERCGQLARLSLTYDMTFLTLLLSSLYEPEEDTGSFRCGVHPWKASQFTASPVTAYAADMTVLLVYHKCLDDWNDEHKRFQRRYARWLEEHYQRAKQLWPNQAGAVEWGMAELSAIETASQAAPDAAANCFGELLGGVFLYREDRWRDTLVEFCQGLGRFLYMMDAVIDWEEDLKRGSYNPMAVLNRPPEKMREVLMLLIGRASQAFERLPLVQDEGLLRNILYSGVWQRYNRMLHQQKEGKRHGQ